jgi:hypothetical protein
MKIAIATPFYNAQGFSQYISSLVATIELLHSKGIQYDYWELPSDTYCHRGKNVISNHFLKETSCTHLFIIDSDMQWTPDSFMRVLERDVDIVGGNYPCKNAYDKWAGTTLFENGKRVIENGLVEAVTIPGGFIKISRKVFDRLIELKKEKWRHGDEEYWDFWSHIKIGDQELGDDVAFCKRCSDVGFRLWLEPDCTITHYGFNGWNENYKNFLERQKV